MYNYSFQGLLDYQHLEKQGFDNKYRSIISPLLKYYELLITRDLKDIQNISLPQGYKYTFWNNDNCINDWVNIHIETGEFNNIEEAYKTFHLFYDSFYEELDKRCFFIEDLYGNKVATSTISPSDEFGYKCVIDWFAISSKVQGKGLSKSLLSKTLQVAKNLGNDRILLHTQTHTWLAAKIYLDFGFEPFNIEEKEGWQILKTITNHPKLKFVDCMDEDEMYDVLIVNIKKQLDKLHKSYNFNVWYKNGRNDVYVNEDGTFYTYKFYDNGNSLEESKQ